jgi:uncharacterized SAM-binding protein YcdF (DUF218 family)
MNTPVEAVGVTRKGTRVWRLLAVALACAVAVAAALMMWGGRLLEASDPLPAHVDAAIVLEGSLMGERVRLAETMQLLRQGVPGRVLLTLPQMSYWGEPVPPLARRFLETNYGHDLAGRVEFCEVGTNVDSTLQEARAIGSCIQAHHWKTVVVVTSNYHTRRAGMIWRKVMRKQNPALEIWVRAADDPEFHAEGWWRQRIWAKTWLLEFTKLVWSVTVGR